MGKTRIFQIAKALNISHKDILSFLKDRKVEISSNSSLRMKRCHYDWDDV